MTIKFRHAAAGAGFLILTGAALMILADPVAASHEETKALYLDKCAVCHGQDGAGKTAKGRKTKVKDVRETIKKESVEAMIKVVDVGKGANMDGFGKELGMEKVKALVEYYRGLAK